MTVSDPIGDLLARIRNGQMRGAAKVKSPFSRQRVRVLDVLQAEGFIRGYAEVEFKGGLKELEIELKYHEGRPVIRELKRVSTPGRRRSEERRVGKGCRSRGIRALVKSDQSRRDNALARSDERMV